MELQLAIPAKNLITVNPLGTVAICTLWTPVDYARRFLAQSAPEILKPQSPLALMGGLYGGGLNIMLRNLYHNPQIDSLILLGKDFSGGAIHLINFFHNQIERTGQKQLFVFDDGHFEELDKVLIPGAGSGYIIDGLLLPDQFLRPPIIYDWSGTPNGKLQGVLADFLAGYSPAAPVGRRPQPISLPRPVVKTFPSDVFSRVITGKTITETWVDLLSTLSRFGRRVKFRNGKERLELLNLKAVISEPGRLEASELSRLNLSESAIAAYKEELLNPVLPDGLPYTYGNRMRGYFGPDLLSGVISDLALEGDSRHAYIALWDNLRDLKGADAPCLVTVFFRKLDGLVHLAAVFRSHNGARAWPVNCVGLHGLNEFVCQRANVEPGRTEKAELRPGTLTVTSLSISLDPADLPQVGEIVRQYDERPYSMVTDPNGYFRITVDLDSQELLVFHHGPDGMLLSEYRGKTPSELAWKLERAKAISNLGHAVYLGGQLERAWYSLQKGREYFQDKSKLTD
ncbi:MAG: hypothetical protein LBT47_08020 [Deltaproteobacteria bacterium]|jgi:thymidylate synthase|nr:hypothetical protein [Deltaproteobacteria bacterium]